MKVKTQNFTNRKKIDSLMVLIKRENLLPSWFDLPFVEFSFSDEIHTGLIESFEKLCNFANEVESSDGYVRHKTELDTSNIKKRVNEFKQYVLGDLDLKPNVFLQTQESGFQKDKYIKSLYEALKRHEKFIHLRNRLRAVAKFDIKNSTEEGKFTIYESGKLVVDKTGIIRFHSDELTDILIGIEVDRIRECKLCKKIFWAIRKDKKCCSPECNNVYNVQNTPKRKKTTLERKLEDTRRERFQQKIKNQSNS